MKMHDDLKHRLEREAEGLRVPEAPLDRLASRGRSRRARRRVAGAAGAAVLVVGVVVPLWLLLGLGGGSDAGPSRSVRPAAGEETPSAQEPPVSAEHLLGTAQCFKDLSPDTGLAVVVGAPDSTSECADFWRKGGFNGGDPVSAGAVPDLAECVRDGAIVVVPGSGASFCEANGMSDVPSDFPDVAARWSNVEDVFKSIEDSPNHCLDEPTFARRVQKALDANGFSDWKVVDDFRNADTQRPCAAPATDFGSLEIKLVNDTWS